MPGCTAMRSSLVCARTGPVAPSTPMAGSNSASNNRIPVRTAFLLDVHRALLPLVFGHYTRVPHYGKCVLKVKSHRRTSRDRTLQRPGRDGDRSGASGLVAAIAERFAAEGASVVIADVNEQKPGPTPSRPSSEAGGKAVFQRLNVTDKAAASNGAVEANAPALSAGSTSTSTTPASSIGRGVP